MGGDFYDVIPLAGGQVGFVIGDVTDKGVPAALVMAATRSVLRASAQRLIEPGAVLERVNEHLCPDMPAKMFVTCLYGVLDPTTGHFRFANAGHDLPYVKTAVGSVELRARGMPLGLMTGMEYEEKRDRARARRLVAAALRRHRRGTRPAGQMFGFPRLKEAVARYPGGGELIDLVLADLRVAHRDLTPSRRTTSPWSTLPGRPAQGDSPNGTVTAQLLVEFEVPSAEGNERIALERVSRHGRAARPRRAPGSSRLETAVGEATMNAMEHGNPTAPTSPVTVRVLRRADRVRVEVADLGGAPAGPARPR